MKKLLSVGLLALCALAISEHRADAWVNSRFSIGLNWHHQSANTSYLWGLWRNGQVPGPEAFGGGGPGGPGQMPPQSQPFPFFGANNPASTQQGMYQPNMMQPGLPYSFPNGFPSTLPPDAAQNAQKVAQQQNYNPYTPAYYGYTGNPYQTVGYQQQGAYYPPSAYYHPYYQPMQNAEVPFYWYYSR